MSAFEFIESERAIDEKISVTAMCRVLGVSTSGFYAWSSRVPSERTQRHEVLASQIRGIYAESGRRYGCIKITRALRRKGQVVSPKTVAKVMARDGLIPRPKRRFKATTDSRNSIRIAPNLLERNFVAAVPNQVWVTDVTAYWTLDGWLFLAAIIDLYARRVIGWSVSSHNDTALALSALRAACALRRPLPGVIHHSDRGSPYCSDDYIAELERIGMIRSMSRKGDCWDNAVAESFFSTLEFECVRRTIFESHEALTFALRDYIENFYNLKRMHATIGYVSPIEAEVAFNLESQAA